MTSRISPSLRTWIEQRSAEIAADEHLEVSSSSQIAWEIAQFGLAVAERVQQEQGWQPIETAPKDGLTYVLLDWSDETGRQIPPKVGFWHSRENAWCDTHQVLHGPAPYQQPTHWQPLPDPPPVGREEARPDEHR